MVCRILAALIAVALIVTPAATAHRIEKPLREALRIEHEEAVRIGEEIGLGSARIVSPDPATPLIAADFGEFIFEYETGRTPVEDGGHVRVLMRHVFHWSPPQTTDPAGEGFTRAEGPEGVSLEVVPWPARPDGFDLFLETFPWQHAIEIRVTAGALRPGDRVRLIYGDRSRGGPGARVQPSEENPYAFRVAVAHDHHARSLPLAQDLAFRIIGGPAERVSIVAPSTPKPGEAINLTLRAEDRYGNRATGFSAPFTVRNVAGRVVLSGAFVSGSSSVVRVKVPSIRAGAMQRYTLKAGELSAQSNPIRARRKATDRIWWGDLHGHTLNSDGRGTVRDFYTYCRDVAALDFCAVTDHGFQVTDTAWAESTATTEAFHKNHKFVTIHAYEWSGLTELGGDHNVYYRGSAPPIYRSLSYYDPRNQQATHGDEGKVGHIKQLYEKLLSFGDRKVMTIPHFGGRQANPEWHEPRIERLIEVFSDHGRKMDWAYGFLDRGYRLGMIGSSDNHTGRPGYGFLVNPLQAEGGTLEVGTALVAVIAPNLTRDGIFDSLYDRRAYATTGDRILLDFSAGKTRMGSEVTSSTFTPLTVDVVGTANIQSIQIVRNGVTQANFTPGQSSARVVWTDPALIEPGETAAYWVHVIQDNKEEAISSPIWWTRS